MVRRVYAEGPLVPGVDMGVIVNQLRQTVRTESIRVHELRPEEILQVWFETDDPCLVNHLQEFTVSGFHFNHLDVI